MRAALVAMLAGMVFAAPALAGTLGTPTLAPASIGAGAPAVVRISVPIGDPNYIDGSANVQRLAADGAVQGIVGTLRDDGQGGDASAGDGIHTMAMTLTEPAGSVRFQVSAAFRKEVRRTVSAAVTLTVTPASGVPTITAARFTVTAATTGVPAVGVASATVQSASAPTTLVLQKIDAAGAVLASLGTLHDDGADGDATAGDANYALRSTVLENSPGTLRYRIAGTFPGHVQTVYSNVFTVAVAGTATGVEITSPANGAYLNTPAITVAGSVGDPAARVTLNGITAVVSGTSFNASVPLNEGPNTITAVATNSGGTTTTASILVTLDTTAPKVEIYSPVANAVTTGDKATVSGMVNDIVVGTVNPQQATVTVNGIAAEVLNRSFIARDVPLQAGANTIQAVATDRAGNRATTATSVTRSASGGLALVSGNNQRAAAGALLAAPLVVALTDARGAPVANRPVVFRVVGLDGTVAATALPGPGLPAVAVNTDSEGKARAYYRLGSRAGGGNLVEASTAAAQATVDFVATGTPGAPQLMVVDSGNNQTGAAGQALPFPLIAIVTDGTYNRLAGVPVTFTVKEGGGGFGPSHQATLQATSDSDGRVAATFALGPNQGVNNNVVEANFAGGTGYAATFTANGLLPGPAAQTRISGVVLDNSNQPIPGVTMRLLQITQGNRSNIPQEMAEAVRTDAQGQFVMQPVPVGVFKLMADGGSATRDGIWPTLDFDMVTVPGQDNTPGMPIFLPALNPNNRVCVDESTGGTLTLPEVPGFALAIAPGSATFPGGSRSGCVHVTPVNLDKVPMAPGFGQQPRFVVTIQPVGTHFSPPARMTIPNVDGLAPRAVTEMYSYDHDLASFVAIGSATVSADGATITSDPGSGVIKAGWHCGGNPNTSGSAGTCPTCQKCEGSSCVADAAKDGQVCDLAPSGQGVCRAGNCVPVRLTILVNNTAGTNDDITALNGPQTLPITVRMDDGPSTPISVTLTLTPGGRGSLNTTTVSLAKGQSTGVVFTPSAASAAANDVKIAAKVNGNELATGNLTVVNITLARIATPTDAAGIPDRITPRKDTDTQVTLVPSLDGSGQSVELATLDTSAANGDYTVGGGTTKQLTHTETVKLRGTVQTAPTGGAGGGNARKLKLAAKVRGAQVTQSNGFSVAAIAELVAEGYQGNVVGVPGAVGIIVSVTVKSDSGTDGDLSECEFSEQIEVKAETGALVGLGGGLNSSYLGCIGNYTDTHSTGTAWLTGAGTQKIDQTHTLKDRRLGITDIPIRRSGFKIDRTVFAPAAPPPPFRLTTSKYGAGATANGHTAQAGTPAAPMTGTQP
ncbi:choice-of-anchor X domain-containing protein [Pseudoduganella armeniaca]|nr:choice-of-anchor X domain-containing protein [Pseudoduganella armeniaca]